MAEVTVIGGGLAGCEAAWQLAEAGFSVRLLEMKPVQYTPAHHYEGLAELVKKSGAELDGAGVVIEKGFQVGGDIIRSKGIHLESLAIVESMDEKTGEVVFRN